MGDERNRVPIGFFFSKVEYSFITSTKEIIENWLLKIIIIINTRIIRVGIIQINKADKSSIL